MATEQTDTKAAQDAQKAEAEDQPRTVTFDGHSYEIAADQPSPKAMEYVARWTVDDENMAMVLAIKEMIGAGQWDLWCTRHKSRQLNEFWLELNKAAGSGN